jgi:hypothetical protein
VTRARAAAVLLAAALTSAGCTGGGSSASPDRLAVASPAAATAGGTAPSRVPLEARGPFRHTARDAFAWSVAPVTAARLGASHRAGCPVAVSDLRLVGLTHWGFDGRTHRGELVVRASVASDVVAVFRRLHAARFPVRQVVTAEQYGADDDRLMAADATSAYNCRVVTGGTGFSEHAYGTALDLNPVQNPYVRGTTVEPPAGRAYLDRADARAGMVLAGDAVVRAFAAVGWEWGGDFRTLKDYQHFSLSGR